MNIKYILPRSVEEKFQLMEFVFNNTDSFIMSTFGFVWENREWWSAFPIQVYKVNDQIIGLHAFTYNHKKPNTIKTYYIVTHKAFRGQGIAKKLILHTLNAYSEVSNNYFVNSEESSEGVEFFKKLFKDKYLLTKNEFGTVDYNFEAPVDEIIANEKKI